MAYYTRWQTALAKAQGRDRRRAKVTDMITFLTHNEASVQLQLNRFPSPDAVDSDSDDDLPLELFTCEPDSPGELDSDAPGPASEGIVAASQFVRMRTRVISSSSSESSS
jgi:hypothetical protein